MTERQQADCGMELARILQLRMKPNGRINTEWGDKTPIGLYLTVKRILEEGESK